MSGLDELGPWFEAHKVPALAAAGAGVVGFALYKRKKAGGADPASQGVTVDPGTLSSGGQLSGAAYSSAANDAYDSLQPQIEDLANRLDQIPTSQAPSSAITAPPIASTLLAPSSSTHLVRFANGQIDQVQSDGSLLWLNASELQRLLGGKSWQGHVDQLTVKPPASVYNTGGNLVAKNTPAKK